MSKLLIFAGVLLVFPFSVAGDPTTHATPCYESHEGADDASIVTRCTELAVQGDAQAQRHLGLAYINGYGVPVDAVFGYMWLEISASQGLSDSTDTTKTRVAAELNESGVRMADYLARLYWSDVRAWLAVVTAHASDGELEPGVRLSWPSCEFTVNSLVEPRWTHALTPIGELAMAYADDGETAVSMACGPLSSELSRLCGTEGPPGRHGVDTSGALLDYLGSRVAAGFAVDIVRAQTRDDDLGRRIDLEGAKHDPQGAYRLNARVVCGEDSIIYVVLLELGSGPPNPEGLIVLDSISRR